MPHAHRSQIVVSMGLTFLSAWMLAGCGASTTAATTPPAHAEVEVVVPKTDAPKEEKPKQGDAVAQAEKGALGKLSDDMLEALNSKDGAKSGVLTGVLDSVQGGVVGGVIGGLGGFGGLSGGGGGGSGVGWGGLGLSGGGLSASGSGGGGTIGLGSIGTFGRGSGSYGVINPVPGNAVHATSRSVLAMGDLTTLGLSLEDATRALRNQSSKLHTCYEQKGLDVSKSIEGEMSLWIVVGKDAKIAYVASDSQRPSPAVVKCVTSALKNVYVATPAGATYGVIQTTIVFKPVK